MFKIVVSCGITFHLAACSPALSHADNSTVSEAALQTSPARNHSGWTQLSFVDFVRNSKSDCIIESDNLVRCAGPLHANALAKTVISGHGAILEFSDSRAGKGGVVLNNASDVVLSDIQIGWLSGGARDPLVPGSQRIQSFGNVVACANQEAGGVLSLDLPLEGTQPVRSVSVWDNALGWPWYRSAPNAYEVYVPEGTVTSFSAGRSACMPQLATLVGRRVLVRHVVYTSPAFLCWTCRNVTVERVRVTSAPGMAFVFGNGGSYLTLRDDVVAPKCSPDCLQPEPSVTADASHFSGVGSHILLEGDDFGWQGDDSVNVTGLLIPARVESESDATGRWLFVEEQSRGSMMKLAVGNTILLFDRGLSAMGDATIIQLLASTGRVKVSQLPPNAGDLIIARADTIPTNVVIKDCRFHDNRARGILMGGSNAVIENNVIERVTMEAILVPSDTGPWYEGPGAKHVRIENNKIADVNRFPAERDYPSAISAGVSLNRGYIGPVGTPIQDIVVQNNSFTNIYNNAAVPVFFGKGVKGGQAKDNK